MRVTQKLALGWAMLTITGCRRTGPLPEAPMPPNTVLLSQMMRELSAQPGFTDALIEQLDTGGAEPQGNKRQGPALLTPKLVDELRKRILGKDWQGLDRFPGWTMREINPTVHVAGKVLGKGPELEGMAAVHPGSSVMPLDDKQARQFLDLGPYALSEPKKETLDKPSTLPGFTTEGIVSELGAGVERGDGANPQLASEHSESQRLADVLNRLAVNKLDGVSRFDLGAPFLSMIHRGLPLPARNGPPVAYKTDKMIAWYSTPEDVMDDLLRTGHQIAVTDSRYFANFGHLHYKGRDVMMPFWINTQIAVPGSGGLLQRRRPLLVPVSHAELEWHIRGPLLNADVSWYFGIDGKAEWRVMDTQDQAWVLKRDAHTYTGEDAVEVTRLTGLMTVAYMHQHAKWPQLPFGGYYALGVCQDFVSAIEHKMTGRSTLFPNTAEIELFDDPRDAEVNALIAAVPKDRAGEKPEPERIFGSLPVAPAPGDRPFDAITIPGLADDLNATYNAWRHGKLERTHSVVLSLAAGAVVLGGLCLVLMLARRRTRGAY